MKKSILFFLIFFAVGFSQIKVFAQTNDKVYKQAMDFYNAKQYDKAIPILENLIKDNNAEAMNMLGVLYGHGFGVDINYDKYYDLLSRASDLGEQNAIINLAWSFLKNEGFRDWVYDNRESLNLNDKGISCREISRYYFKLLAKKDVPEGFFGYAITWCEWHEDGEYCSWEEGKNALLKAVEMNYPQALLHYACHLAFGTEFFDTKLDNDYAQALKLLKQAKEKGVEWFIDTEERMLDEENVSVGDMIAICEFMLSLGNKMGTLNSWPIVEDSGTKMIVVERENKKKAIVRFNSHGKLLSKTEPFFKDLFYDWDIKKWHALKEEGGDKKYFLIDMNKKFPVMSNDPNGEQYFY